MGLPSGSEIVESIPVIISLIVIEGLLSIDNALAIAAVARQLPGKQKYQALKFGIIGAYLFRGLALAFAAFIIANPWLRILGAAYLLYLMSKNLGFDSEGDGDVAAQLLKPSFLLAIIQIELLDLSLSIDNVVAAVAFSPKLWVVCTGVFIGILALRFLAGYCIRLLEIFPILEKTAFLLIGFVGLILVVEETSISLGHDIHVDSIGKFVGIVLIILATILYDRYETVNHLARPLIAAALPLMRMFANAMDLITWPFQRIVRAARGQN